MSSARIYYLNGTFKKIYPKSKWFEPVYQPLGFNGGARCYELKMPKFEQAYGIKHVRFYFKFEVYNSTVDVYLHYPGQFLTNLDKKVRNVGINEKLEYDIEHEVHEVLELDGKLCNPDYLYNQDICAQSTLFNVSSK